MSPRDRGEENFVVARDFCPVRYGSDNLCASSAFATLKSDGAEGRLHRVLLEEDRDHLYMSTIDSLGAINVRTIASGVRTLASITSSQVVIFVHDIQEVFIH